MTIRINYCDPNYPEGLVLASAEVTSLPGCSQVAVIHNSFVLPQARGLGVGKAAHAERLEQLQGIHLYDAAVCTVDEDNFPQISILESAGWSRTITFTSRKTGHNVSLWVKELI